MSYSIWDYLVNGQTNDLKEWTQGLQKEQRARLNSKLRLLRQQGEGLLPHILTPTKEMHILELVIKGRVALRPQLCRGPAKMLEEFTLLLGAQENDNKYYPKDAPQKAEARRKLLNRNPSWRREHEWVS